jgi:hypothetical protein
MLGVARIEAKDVARYESIAAQSKKRLSERILEMIASLDTKKRDEAINKWAEKDLSVRGLEIELRKKTSKSVDASNCKSMKKQSTRKRKKI